MNGIDIKHKAGSQAVHWITIRSPPGVIQLLWFISVRMPRGMVAGSVFWGIYCLLSHSRSEESDSVKKSQSGFCFSKKKHAGKWTPNCNSMNSSLKWLSQTVSCFFFFFISFSWMWIRSFGKLQKFLKVTKVPFSCVVLVQYKKTLY